ncbi:MAG: hypothetical protein ABGZ17_10410 [Planctomycetaceae bacterium]
MIGFADHVVVTAIEFADELPVDAGKIFDERRNWMPASKFESAQAAAQEDTSEQ